MKRRFWYKVLEQKLPPDRRKVLIVAPDISGGYHAYVENIGNVFDVQYLEYDADSSIEDNLARLEAYANNVYFNRCSDWRCVETDSPLEE